MADLLTLHLFGDFERERELARRQQARNEIAAASMHRVASTIQGGAALNTLKGVMPFTLHNASRGLATVATPMAGATIYTGVPMQPVQPAPQRRGRGRSRR